MENTFELIIFGKRLYREIELPFEGKTQVKIGTTKEAEIRFNKALFFEEFELELLQGLESWQLHCSENVYVTTDGIMKASSKDLAHGNELTIKYTKSGAEVLKLQFLINFNMRENNYQRKIDIAGVQAINIGGNDRCAIRITDKFIGRDDATLRFQNGFYTIIDNRTKYGVYVNGAKINESEAISDYDFFMIAGYSFYLKAGALYTTKSAKLSVHSLRFEDLQEQMSALPYPKFNRTTRIQYVVKENEIEVLPPKPKPQKPKENLVVSLVPSLVMLGLTVVLRGIMGGGGMFVLYSAATMGTGIIMSVVSYFSAGKKYKLEVEKRMIEYQEYIAKKEREIADSRAQELRLLELTYSSLDVEMKACQDFSGKLFERDIHDVDFLSVRLGSGLYESKTPLKITQQEFKDPEDELLDLPELLNEKYRFIRSAPILSDFFRSNAVGVIGNMAETYNLLKVMTLDLTTRHFYKDLQIFYIFKEKDCNLFEWLRWFKHIQNEQSGTRNLIYDRESMDCCMEFLFAELSKREELAAEEEKIFFPQYVIFVLDAKSLAKHPVSRYVETCGKYGFTFVFFERYSELLPKGCSEIIELSSSRDAGKLTCTADGEVTRSFDYRTVSDTTAAAVALRLGSVYVDEVNLESELTKNITLFELLHIFAADDLDLSDRWGKSEVYKTIAAPLGVRRNGEIVCLDISDKSHAHGPHGLVAGTTGSGKSELLQTYVLTIATLFHPYDVSFVIIDFKGGGMANQFQNLPHLNGTITNIDGREIDRSLLSIKAELLRRQELFSTHDVNHIDDYIRLFKSKKAQVPLPHLILIVDEFAELKNEYPEFMKEIISAARIGRTLGIHLILATQKPSGIVDNQIWSNSKFKLCLKVQSKEDSNEVLKTPLAAEIVEPGRAYFQVGNNEVFELFQSAYSGAKVLDMDGQKQKNIELYELNLWGKRKQVYSNKVKKDDHQRKNQLQAVVEYIHEFAVGEAIEALPGICLPPLADKLMLSGLLQRKHCKHGSLHDGIFAVVGLLDDPQQQKQSDMRLNLSQDNTYIIGSALTGKTTFLQTLIYDLIERYTPDEVNIYILDCGNMALKVFEESHHVGGVALVSEDTKVENLFKLLKRIIEQRKSVFAKKGLGTFHAYVEASFNDMPQIIFIVDNYAAYKEYYPDGVDDISLLSREGQSVGISLVITANLTNMLGARVLANFGTKIAFTCNDSGEYSNIFERCRLQPKDTPGRALVLIEKRILEFQTALCTKGEKEIERMTELRETVARSARTYPNSKALPIPQVPGRLESDQLYTNQKELYEVAYKIPVGIAYDTVEYVMFDLLSTGLFFVSGREKSGKTNFVKQLLSGIQKNVFGSRTEAYIFDGIERPLASCEEYGFVDTYTIDAEDFAPAVENIDEMMQERYDAYVEAGSDEQVLEEFPLILMVIENAAILQKLNKDKNLYQTFQGLIKQYKKMKMLIIFTDIENAVAGFNAPEAVKWLKENKKGIFFDDIANIKFVEPSMVVQRSNKKPIELGDAFWYSGGEFARIKTIFDGKITDKKE